MPTTTGILGALATVLAVGVLLAKLPVATQVVRVYVFLGFFLASILTIIIADTRWAEAHQVSSFFVSVAVGVVAVAAMAVAKWTRSRSVSTRPQ